MRPEDEDKKPGHIPQADGDSSHDESISSADEQVLQALRNMPATQAPDIVRARAKHAFLRGRAGQAAPVEATDSVEAPRPVTAEDDATPKPRSQEPLVGRVVKLNPRRSNRVVQFAFAAVIVLMLFGYGAQSPHPWRITAVTDPDGDLRGRTDRTVGTVIPAGSLESPEHGTFELSMGPSLTLRMAPCSGIVLPRAPRRWGPGDINIEVVHGELFGSTGGQELPAPVNITTDVLTAQITGTTFAVFRIPGATCVCLLEGGVQISPTVGDTTPVNVPRESKMLIYNDGRPHEVLPIDDMERMKLQMLYDHASQR